MWNNKDDEDSDYNDYYFQKEREEFKKESDRISNASEEDIDQELIKLGYDPEKLKQEGMDFLEILKQKVLNS